MASALKLAGFKLRGRTTVIDDLDDIVRAARDVALRGTDLCVVAGGLGPTDDDVTSDAFAKLLEVELRGAQLPAISQTHPRLRRHLLGPAPLPQRKDQFL